MEDIALKWIKELGVPISYLAITVVALVKIFGYWQAEVKKNDKNRDVLLEALTKNSTAMDSNTKELHDQTAYLKKFGSDPLGLCKAKEVIAANGFTCPSEAVLQKMLDNIVKKRA